MKTQKTPKIQYRGKNNGMSMPMIYSTQLLQCASARERVWRIGHTKYLLFKRICLRAFYKDMLMHLEVYMGEDCVACRVQSLHLTLKVTPNNLKSCASAIH